MKTQQLYRVRFLRYGYSARGVFHPAAWTVRSFAAVTPRQAVELARRRYRRAEQFTVVP
jgi:hypothetical protein